MKKTPKIVVALILCACAMTENSTAFAQTTQNQKIVPKITIEASAIVEASPDIAEINFTIREEAKTIKEASQTVTKKINEALVLVQSLGVAKKDTKLTSNGFYPQYDYIQCVTTPCNSQILRGYQAYRSIKIIVRDLDKAPEITQALSGISITEMSGPEFKLENEKAVRSQARQKAVAEARQKARDIAKDLGVRLVRIVSFSEQPDYYAYPVAYKAMDSVGASAEAPILPEGKNSFTSRVTVEYEIR